MNLKTLALAALVALAGPALAQAPAKDVKSDTKKTEVKAKSDTKAKADDKKSDKAAPKTEATPKK